MKHGRLSAALIVTAVLATSGHHPARADAPAVVVSVLPVHSLVAGVMDGVGSPRLLLDGGASPHAYSLKPSEARQLANARVVVWVGEALEAFLERPLAALAGKARIVEAQGIPGVVNLPVREGGVWDGHADEPKGHGSHGTGDTHGHAAHRSADGHLWLDPANAKVIVRAVATALAAADAANAVRYRANATAMAARIDELNARLRSKLAPLAGKPYIVFHDAYQYMERRYGLTPAGAVTVSPGRSPGAKRLIELRTRIRSAGAACVFIEPQFEPRIARTVIEGTGARLGTLDPLGAGLAPGKDAYFTLMEKLAENLAACLAPRG